MLGRLHGLLLRAYGRLPRRARRLIVRVVAPSFNVGAMCVIERHDGALLLVRQVYREGWAAPGGLLRRREEPAAGAVREAQEELGVAIDVLGEPKVIIDPNARRIDVVYRCRISAPTTTEIRPTSAEIVEVGWFLPEQLPPLQKEVAEALRQIGVLERSQRPEPRRRRGVP